MAAMRRVVVMLGMGLILHAAPVFAQDAMVSVGIFAGRRTSACTIGSTEMMEVRGEGAEVGVSALHAKEIRLVAEGSGVVASAQEGGEWAQGSRPLPESPQVTLTSSAPIQVTPEGAKARTYRGSLVVTAQEGRLTLVNTIAMEDYLRGVVPAEVPSLFALEALKAQAIAARTYALSARGKHKAAGYDLCDSTHCQVYLGVEEEDPRVDAAIRDTVGLVVTFEGKPINAVYHDTCGGYTAGNEEVWAGGSPVPYLRPVPDTCGVPALCAASPRARWTRRIPQEQVVAALSGTGVAGRLTLIAPEGCEDGTRPDRYRITTESGAWVVRAATMRDLLNRTSGAQTLLSPYFIALLEGDSVAITGWGNGHGVGLCQWGANALAKSGMTAAEILAHYYSGTRVERYGAS